MVIVSNSYATLDLLLLSLGQHAKMFPAVGVRQRLGGRTQYRVIVFPYGGGTREILPKVQNLFLRAWLVNASRVQESMTGNFPPAAARPAQETAREEMPVASQKPPTDQKRPADHKPPVEKLEAINKAATETVAAANAGDWEARSAAVREQLKAEDYQGVGRNAQALARDFPERWESWFWLGTAQLAQGQMGMAEAALERASKLNPKVAQIWVQRAIAAQERGDHATAVRLLNEARELAPKSPQIYLNLGYSNDSLGATAEAEKNYLRFLSLTEGDSSYATQRKPVIERLEKKR
jgi:tetratricopeptide (TPR) repeat protein